MQRAEHEKAGLGRSEREGDRFEIAHFPHQHNIGVLAQCRLQPSGKRSRIPRHFPLRDRASLIVVHEFDRFFDCHDVLGKVLINVIDQRGLRRRFAGTGWAGNKDKAAAQVSKFFYNHGDPQLLECSNLGGNQTKSCAVTIRLLEIVTAKARRPVHLVSKIEITVLLENLPVAWTANFAHHLHGFLAFHRLRTNGHDIAMHAHFRWFSFTDVQVGPAVLDNYT